MNNKISCQQDRPPRPQPLLRQRKTLWFLVSFLVVFTLGPAGAARIEGTVSGKDGLLAGANVRLEDTRLHSTSSDSGRFVLTNVPSGQYTLLVTHIGYQTLRRPVVASRDDTLSLTLALEKAPAVLPATVVTGTRSPRFSDDTPVYTTLVSKEDIAAQGAVRLGEILREQTGLNVIADHGTGVQVQGFDPDYTLVLLDGEPVIGRTAGTLDLQRFAAGNLEQVEIVKGPTSSLYGSEALAGVVNLITRRPQSPFAARLQSRYATHNSADVGAQVELTRGPLGLLLFANLNRSNGYDLSLQTVDPTTPQFTDLTLHPKLTYQFNDKTDLTLALRLKRETQHSVSTIRKDGVESVLDDDDTANDVSLSTQVGWRPRPGLKSVVKLYGARFSTEGRLTRQADNSLQSRSDFVQSYYKGEIQFDATAGTQHLFTWGGGYIGEEVEADRIAAGKQSSHSLFLFAQDEWSPRPYLDLVFSARNDDHSDFAAHLSPKVAALIRLKPWLRLRASAGRGFKSPEFRQLYLDFTNSTVGYSVFGTTTVDQSLSQLQNTGQIQHVLLEPAAEQIEPEKSAAYNLGFDVRPRPNLQVRFNFFRNNVRDLIDTAPIAVKSNNQRVFSYFNINKVYTQGLESEVEVALSPNVELGFGYQYLYAKDQDVVDQIKNGQLFALQDDGRSRAVRPAEYGGLFNRSKHSGNIRMAYRHERSALKGTVRGILRGRYGYADQNANQILDRDDEYLPGYALWNLTLRKSLSPFTVQLGVDNLFDKTDPKTLPSLPGRILYTGVNRTF